MTNPDVKSFPVLVCGGRYYNQSAVVESVLSRLEKLIQIYIEYGNRVTIVTGGATGADALAASWASSCADRALRQFHADWKSFGRGAGPIRNSLMLSEGNPRIAVAFPGGKGTADMLRKLNSHRIPTLKIPNTPITNLELETSVDKFFSATMDLNIL